MTTHSCPTTTLASLLLGLSLSGCVSGLSENVVPPVFSPGELNKRSKELDGVELTVHGFVVHEPEAYGIWDNEAAERDGDATRCVSLQYPEALQRQVTSANRTHAYLLGVFHRDVTAGGGLFLGLCNFSGVTVTSVVHE